MGRVFREGDVVTLDGSKGEALAGVADMLPPALDDSFKLLLSWADQFRDIGIRANADTPADAATARRFEAQGIGLCRTEHMFFDEDRLVVMREMIFADSPGDRAAALARLLADATRGFRAAFRDHGGDAGLHPPVRPAAARIPAGRPRGSARAGRGAGPPAVAR
jgi:pyruvate,orthophosphate dikinase